MQKLFASLNMARVRRMTNFSETSYETQRKNKFVNLSKTSTSFSINEIKRKRK